MNILLPIARLSVGMKGKIKNKKEYETIKFDHEPYIYFNKI